MASETQPGKVILAGAGPGDPELVTVKLARYLGEADVIITDRLVNPVIIERHARPGAAIILAGKQGYNNASLSQDSINEIILQHAKTGKKVVRLKGGDTAFFSNILDELRVITEHAIPFEIIPGITAASGASAFTGIPLTARGYAQGVQFLTFNPNSRYPPEKWKQLAQTDDTLVFYMAARNIPDLAELLLRYTRTPDMPLAVVEQATTVHQQLHTSTLQRCSGDFKDRAFSSPSLVIIGTVVALHHSFGWFHSGMSGGSVFAELERDH